MTKAEREAELKELNRMKLRGVAMDAGFDHKKSLRAHSEDMIEFILNTEYGEEAAEEPPPKKAPKKGSKAAKKPAKKPAKKKAAEPSDDAATKEDIEAMGQVLDSHGEALEVLQANQDQILANQDAILALLKGFLYLQLEPDAVEALLEEAGIPEDEEDPS